MKTHLIPLLAMAFLALTSGSCTDKEGEKDQEQEQEKEFSLDSYNGRFVKALSDAYDTFEETDELPSTINVDGITYAKAKYVAGACLLIERITASPDKWQETDIELPKATASSEDKWNTFDPDSLSFDEVKWMSAQMYDYAVKNSRFPNFCTFPSKYVESDGTEHDNQLTFNNSAVILARLFNEYASAKGTFPKKICSWQSDFLRKTDHCESDDPLVVSTMKSITQGKNTDFEKAKALFEFSRDQWEWQDYPNTNRGSVKTIEDKAGNCCDLSHALIAMTRAAGIPARYMHGQCQFSSSVIGHVFVEIRVDGKWYICDPSNNNNEFGTHNWKHMATFNGRYKTLPF